MSKSPRDEAVQRRSNMREKAMAIAMKRKEEYLGARVPKALKERVIKKADDMGIPVSLLIRRLLEQTFPEHGTSSAGNTDSVDVGNKSVGGNQAVFVESYMPVTPVEQSKADKYTGIIGWKLIEVNQDRSCERCKEPLPRGAEALLGFTSTDAGYVILCPQCKLQVTQ